MLLPFQLLLAYSPRVFKGKHKWLGGAVNPGDGSIFGIPSNADSVIRIVPVTNPNDNENRNVDNGTVSSECVELVKLPDEIQRGRYKWLRGIMVHGHLYGIPAWSNHGVLKVPIVETLGASISNNSKRVDIVGTPTVLPLPSRCSEQTENDENEPSSGGIRKDRWMWHGAALSKDSKYIYCIPSNADRVLKIRVYSDEKDNDQSSPIEEIGPSFHGKNKWYGGIRGLDGCIYGAPYTASGILKIDPKDDTVHVIGDFGISEWKWHGGVLCKNGAIFCFPSHSSYALKINTSLVDNQLDESYSLIELPATKDGVQKYKWLGGAIGEDGAVYAMPCDTNSVLRIDPMTDETCLFGITCAGKNKWQGGVLGPDGCIYAVPADADNILKIDTRSPFDANSNNDWRVTSMGPLPPTRKKWQGGFLANDHIYAVSSFIYDTIISYIISHDFLFRFLNALSIY